MFTVQLSQPFVLHLGQRIHSQVLGKDHGQYRHNPLKAGRRKRSISVVGPVDFF